MNRVVLLDTGIIGLIRPLHNIISRPKVSLVKESTRIKIILIA